MENNQLASLIVGREAEDENMIDANASNEEMNLIEIGDSSSESNSDDQSVPDSESDHQELPVSDDESSTGSCVENAEQFDFDNGNGLISLEEGGQEHTMVKQRFFSAMGDFEKLTTTVVAIHKISYSSIKEQSFQNYSQAMAAKRGGNANIRYVWYNTSMDGIRNILSHGFGQAGIPVNNELYGNGIYLVPEDSTIESVLSSIADENSLRHLLLCRAILGNLEVVRPDSNQLHPSSERFDSGVDNLLTPKRFIVWSSDMNNHILPIYAISFKTPHCLRGLQRSQEPPKKPTSPWIPFPALVSVLSRLLPSSTVRLIDRYHQNYRENKIARPYLIQRVRQLVGDRLLTVIIQSYRRQGGGRGVNPSELQRNTNTGKRNM